MINIAVTNLGKYNEGELVFEWLRLPATEDEIEEVLEAIGINEYYEEFFISDYETDLAFIDICEYTNIYRLNELAEKLENLSWIEIGQIGGIIESTGCDFDEAWEIFEEKRFDFVRCDISTDEELGGVMVDEGLFDVPEHLQNFMDYGAIGRLFSCSGWTIVSDGAIYVY